MIFTTSCTYIADEILLSHGARKTERTGKIFFRVRVHLAVRSVPTFLSPSFSFLSLSPSYIPSHAYLRKKPVSRDALTLDYRGVNTGNGSRYPNQYFRMPFLKIDPSLPDAPDQLLPRVDFEVYFYLSERIDRSEFPALNILNDYSIGWDRRYVLNSVDGHSLEVSNPVWVNNTASFKHSKTI